jgi:hypothetical protein
MVDASTTGLALAEQLPDKSPLTVITNFLAIVKRLAGEPGIDLIALGGAFYPAYDAFLGMRTNEAIRSLRADTLFMSTTAVTDGYCNHQSQETVAVTVIAVPPSPSTVPTIRSPPPVTAPPTETSSPALTNTRRCRSVTTSRRKHHKPSPTPS